MREKPIQIKQIEDSVFEIPIHLTESLESQRAILRATLIAAQKRLRNFAQKHGWHPHTFGDHLVDKLKTNSSYCHHL
jgi:hypothetical protein